jgi:hypothetical protein
MGMGLVCRSRGETAAALAYFGRRLPWRKRMPASNWNATFMTTSPRGGRAARGVNSGRTAAARATEPVSPGLVPGTRVSRAGRRTRPRPAAGPTSTG